MDMRVLLIEDNLALQQLIAHLFRKRGHDVVAVASFDAAVNYAHDSIDAVVSDWDLRDHAGRTGADFLRWFAQHAPDVGRIMMTGNLNVPEVDRAAAHHTFFKPFRPLELVRLLELFFAAASDSHDTPISVH